MITLAVRLGAVSHDDEDNLEIHDETQCWRTDCGCGHPGAVIDAATSAIPES